jgi:micrococcal nuclease
MSAKPLRIRRQRRFFTVVGLLTLGILLMPDAWIHRVQEAYLNAPTSHSSTLESPLKRLNTEKWLSSQGHARVACHVAEVVDGDTIFCDLNHNGQLERPNEKIRFLQVDTPETTVSKRNPTGEAQPYGLEAKAYTRDATLGKRVYLEFDQKIRDPYGRTLAWVYLDAKGGKSVNEGLLEAGLAKVLIYAPNYKHQRIAQALESQAKQAGRGLWNDSVEGS